MSMGFTDVKREVTAMKEAQERTLRETGRAFHQNRVICGYSVNLHSDGEYMVGCAMVRTTDPETVARFIWERI